MEDRESLDQVIFATGGYDHTIKLWQSHTGLCYRTYHIESQVNALEVAPNRNTLAAASYQHIYVYDLLSNNPNPVIAYDGIQKNVTAVGFQADGRWMYSGGEDGRARIWDLNSKTTQCPKIFEAKAPISCICLHPNQVELFIGDQNGSIHRWDLKTNQNEQLIPESDTMILGLHVDASGSMLAAVNNLGRCYVWNLHNGKSEEPSRMTPRHKFQAHNRHALCCRFSEDGRYLATTSADQTARIWQTHPDFSLKCELKQENQRWVWDAAFSADGQYIFTVSSDGYPKIWNVESGLMEKEYAGHQKAVTALALHDFPS